jgi:hypothetical protein
MPREKIFAPNGKGFVQPSEKGEKRGGRPAGSLNKVTKLLREAILQAAEEVGEPEMLTSKTGKVYYKKTGKDGTVGYLRHLALRDPKSFASLLGRVMPLQIVGSQSHPLRLIAEGADLQEASEAYADTVRQLKHHGTASLGDDDDVDDAEIVNNDETRKDKG